MFSRVKKSGKYQYLQIVENKREGKKVKQSVIATIGRLDKLQEKGRIETLIRSLSRFSEKALLILSGKSAIKANAKKIGPSLIFERLWIKTGINDVLKVLLKERKFKFNIERVLFLTVLHRLFVSGSDRFCEKWRRDYKIKGTEKLSLHHFYRAMAFLGEKVETVQNPNPFSPRRVKDKIEEDIFLKYRDLFSDLEMVFFDTTSIYFEGKGGEKIGNRGYSKDHRSDLKQMIVGVVMDNNGRPLCCEVWPGNTADVTSLIPVIRSIQTRFHITNFCIVADRGMISNATVKEIENNHPNIKYILGARMRKVNEVKKDVLSRAGRYKEIYPESQKSKKHSPLKVKEVQLNGSRYILCLNTKLARKKTIEREEILKLLEEKLKQDSKELIGNKGYKKYLKATKDGISINYEKAIYDARFDGKWVLKTNTDFPAEEVAHKYKELWQVEHIFRNMKSLLATRPVYHQRDDTITGHVFCSFLALILLKELNKKLENAGYDFEWEDIKQDLKALQEVIIEENGKKFAIRTDCLGNCGKVFKAVGVAVPPKIREL